MGSNGTLPGGIRWDGWVAEMPKFDWEASRLAALKDAEQKRLTSAPVAMPHLYNDHIGGFLIIATSVREAEYMARDAQMCGLISEEVTDTMPVEIDPSAKVSLFYQTYTGDLDYPPYRETHTAQEWCMMRTPGLLGLTALKVLITVG